MKILMSLFPPWLKNLIHCHVSQDRRIIFAREPTLPSNNKETEKHENRIKTRESQKPFTLHYNNLIISRSLLECLASRSPHRTALRLPFRKQRFLTKFFC